MSDEHEHHVSVIRFDGKTEWEICSCGVKRCAGGPWFVPRTAPSANDEMSEPHPYCIIHYQHR